MNTNKRTLRQSIALALLVLSMFFVQMGQVQVAKADILVIDVWEKGSGDSSGGGSDSDTNGDGN